MSTFRDIKMIWEVNGNQGNLRHFAILPLAAGKDEEAETAALKMVYRIVPIFYPDRNTKFSEYNEFISRLKADVLGLAPEQLKEEPLPAPAPAPAAVAPQIVVPPSADAIEESVERLRTMTHERITQYQVGELDG
jgi:hypothetical protein